MLYKQGFYSAARTAGLSWPIVLPWIFSTGQGVSWPINPVTRRYSVTIRGAMDVRPAGKISRASVSPLPSKAKAETSI